MVAPETARALGEQFRLLNSYYSNLIEGHRTTIPDIEAALGKRFDQVPAKRYCQELCAAHVLAERELMQNLSATPDQNVCAASYLQGIHRAFYSHLPPEHLFTHADAGFTDLEVRPGEFRDVNVSVDGNRSIHGPVCGELPDLMDAFAAAYDPAAFHGDERLLAAAASHHRFTWLHPFRDGNGRVARLLSGLYLARCGVNRSNLWSLSRGLSRQKPAYIVNLFAADSPGEGDRFSGEMLGEFCEFFLEVCLDQIGFMSGLLRLDQLEARVDWYVETKSRDPGQGIGKESSKLLRAVLMEGSVPRGRAPEILGQSERTARRTVATLLKTGLLKSASHRAPLTIGLTSEAMRFYFPGLYDLGALEGTGSRRSIHIL